MILFIFCALFQCKSGLVVNETISETNARQKSEDATFEGRKQRCQKGLPAREIAKRLCESLAMIGKRRRERIHIAETSKCGVVLTNRCTG
jgi:hypothetical protein